MQNTKDSFFIAMRDRLVALNPARTVTVLGVTRPAVIVAENEVADAAPSLPETFYLSWKECTVTSGTERLDLPLMQLTCEITYFTQGSSDFSSQDRGRTLAALDAELFAITGPTRAPLQDHSQSTAVDLGTNIMWTSPTLGPITHEGSKLTRTAKLFVFTFAEAA